MKNVVFWDVACGSSETSVHTGTTQHHIPENAIFIPYILKIVTALSPLTSALTYHSARYLTEKATT
jgi:hypothetical protein